MTGGDWVKVSSPVPMCDAWQRDVKDGHLLVFVGVELAAEAGPESEVERDQASPLPVHASRGHNGDDPSASR